MTTTSIRPQGRYVAAVVHNDTVSSAGMTPRTDGELLAVGPVSADGRTGTIDVAAASDLAARATARAAVGVVSLPGGAPVEVQLTMCWARDLK